MKKALLTVAAVASMMVSAQAQLVTIFSENMGSPTGTTTIGSNVFENMGTLSYAGTLTDVRATSASFGYTGASGGGNIFFSSSAGTRSFTISQIDTRAFEPESFTLTFGARKGTNASNMTGLTVSFSTDGTTYTPLSFDAVSTGSGTSTWFLITVTNAGIIPVTDSLSLRWEKSDGVEYRLDDVVLSGVAVPEPHEYAVAMAGLLLAVVVMRRRTRA